MDEKEAEARPVMGTIFLVSAHGRILSKLLPPNYIIHTSSLTIHIKTK